MSGSWIHQGRGGCRISGWEAPSLIGGREATSDEGDFWRKLCKRKEVGPVGGGLADNFYM